MSIDLTVSSPISNSLQPVTDQAGDPSALSIAKNSVSIRGQDIVGSALPMVLNGEAVNGASWGRLLRLISPTGAFFDIGIDVAGNLFLNCPSSTDTNHVLTVSQTGVITIGN